MQTFKIEAKVKKQDKNLIDIIKACGIEYPHESLAFFSSVYAKFEEANKNGVELANSVKSQVPQLRGTQVNINHLRKNWIVGTILDAWVVNDEIKIAFSFYKSVYPDLYENALELLENDELTVSFELKVAKADIENKSNGVRRLLKVSFDGVGLLLGEKPACPDAIVYEQANINQLREQDLIFANKIINIKKEEDLIVDKKANEALLAKQKEFVIKEFGEDAVKDWTDEDFVNEAKIDELRKSLNVEKSEAETKEEKVEAETKEEITSTYECECIDCGEVVKSSEHCKDIKCSKCGGEMRRKDRPGTGKGSEEATEVKKEEKVAEEKTEEKAEETVVETETKETVKETMDNEKMTDKIERTTESVTKVNDKVVTERKTNEEVTYTYAQVEEIKSDYEKKLEAKDNEITDLKSKLEEKNASEKAEKVTEIRSKLGDFVKDLSDDDLFNEDKIKIATLEKENSELKTGKEVTSEEELETGHEDEVIENKEENLNGYIRKRYEQK